MKKIRFLNLAVSNKDERKKLIKIFSNSLDDGVFVLGKKVLNFEKKIARKLNRKYAVGVSSGTNALYLSLKSIGIKAGDEVLVPCMSWYSSFTAIVMAGGIPIGVDIKDNLLMDLNNIKKKITKKTKAILYVHFTGLVQDLTGLKKFCKKKNFFLIEDCAQSFYGKIKNQFAGSFSDVSAFSTNPMKNYAGLGDSGFVTTNSFKIYKKLLILRYAGIDMKKDECIYPDLNNKIDTLQASILDYRLSTISEIIKKIISNASYYEKNLLNIKKPIFSNKGNHVYYTYQIIHEKRNELKNFLEKNGIETKIQQNKLIYDHYGFKNFNKYSLKFPNGNILKNKILCLPIHEKLNQTELKFITNKVNEFCN
jgi:dTDP-4-amino-4,6-dideoxygalactose transaminase